MLKNTEMIQIKVFWLLKTLRNVKNTHMLRLEAIYGFEQKRSLVFDFFLNVSVHFGDENVIVGVARLRINLTN